MEPLQSFNFRVSSTLSDFEATPLHAPARAAAELKRWLVASAQQPVTAAPFSEIYAAVSSQAGQLPQLASRLAWVAQEAARQLQQLQAGTAADASNPRLKLALSNAFKLALFFLAHMHTKAAAQAVEAPAKGSKKASTQLADAVRQRLQLLYDTMRGLHTGYELLCGSAVLPAGQDFRAAEQLVRATAGSSLVRQLPRSDKGSKAAEEGLRRSHAGIFIRALSCGAELAGSNPAAHAVRDLLAIITQPKQHMQALQDVAFIVVQLLQCKLREGVSLLACIMQAAAELQHKQGASSAQLDSVLSVVSLVASSEPTAVLLYCKELAAMLQSSHTSTRRLLLDIASSALQHCATNPAAQQHGHVLLATLVSGLQDKDASLRAKAVGCLEKNLVAVVRIEESAAEQEQLGAVIAELAARLCDKSLMVRKKALQLLGALLGLELPPCWHQLLSRYVLPVATKLLGVKPDSELHSGEEAAQALCKAVLAMAGHSASGSALRQLLRLSALVASSATAEPIHAALANMVLGGGSSICQAAEQQAVPEARSLVSPLVALLAECTEGDMTRLAAIVQAAVLQASKPARGRGASGRLAARRIELVQACYVRLHELLQLLAPAPMQTAGSGGQAADSEEMWQVLKVLFVLGPLSDTSPQAAAAETLLLLKAAQQAQAVLASLAHSTQPPSSEQQQGCSTESASQPAAPKASDPSASETPNLATAVCSEAAPMHYAMRWSLRCVAGALRQLHSDSPAPGAAEAAAEVLYAVGVIQARALPVVAATLVSVADDAACSAALEVVQSLPDAQAASMQLLAHLSRLVASEAPPPDHHQLGAATGSMAAFAFDEEQGLLRASNATTASPGMQDARWPAQRQRALLSLLQLLTAMAGGYERDKAAFKQQLKRQGAGAAAGAAGGQPAAQLTVDGGTGFDYMQEEDEEHKREAAAQQFLDEVLAAADTPPVSHLPLLEGLLQPAGGEGAVPEAVQAAAVRCLGRLLVLSQALCTAHLPLLEACLASGRPAGVRGAAAAALADVVDAFPSIHGSKLALVGRMAVLEGCSPDLRQQAAAAYARLLLQNKLKLQGMLGVVGEALAGTDRKVARILHHALSHLLQAAGLKERARAVMDLLHQTPLQSRATVVQVLTSSLLLEADCRSDLLVGQAAQAFFAAAGGPSAEPLARLLSCLKPSPKVLPAFKSSLEAWSSTAVLSAGLLQHLKTFVSNYVAGAADGADGKENTAVGAQEALALKRKRPTAAAGAGKKQGTDGLRRQLLGLLDRMGAPGRKGAAGGGGRPARSVAAAASGQR